MASVSHAVGISFDQPIDVVAMLTANDDGLRPRMPRIEVSGAIMVRDGATTHRTRARDISQGGIKVESAANLPADTEVVVSLPGLGPRPAVVRWSTGAPMGLSFNEVLTLPRLADWLRDQRDGLRAAG